MTITSSSRLLINENPLQVLPSLAVALKNVNEAIMLQQVQYWLSRSTKAFEGRKWVYNTIDDWKMQFPFSPVLPPCFPSPLPQIFIIFFTIHPFNLLLHGTPIQMC